MSAVIAETERLRLREWDNAAKAEFARVTNTPAVMRWLGGVADAGKLAAAFDRIEGYQQEYGHTLWAVERKSDGALLGFCGIKRVNTPEAPFTGDFEVGWRLREDAWGQGYAKEAAIASLDLAFGTFGAPHVVALTVAGNHASQGLMKRLGMTLRDELRFVERRFADQPELTPTIVYRIEAADWPAARAKAVG